MERTRISAGIPAEPCLCNASKRFQGNFLAGICRLCRLLLAHLFQFVCNGVVLVDHVRKYAVAAVAGAESTVEVVKLTDLPKNHSTPTTF